MKCRAFDNINTQIKKLIAQIENDNRLYREALIKAKAELEAMLAEQTTKGKQDENWNQNESYARSA